MKQKIGIVGLIVGLVIAVVVVFGIYRSTLGADKSQESVGQPPDYVKNMKNPSGTSSSGYGEGAQTGGGANGKPANTSGGSGQGAQQSNPAGAGH